MDGIIESQSGLAAVMENFSGAKPSFFEKQLARFLTGMKA
tara:strand:- start:50141 stop:50260 length:120 start_codon:yes stop_codon:yes gene_type:complete